MPGLRVHTPDLVPAWQDVDKIPVVHSRTSGHHGHNLSQFVFVTIFVLVLILVHENITGDGRMITMER